MGLLAEILGLILLSAVKYLFAVVPLLSFSNRVWYLDMFIVMIGGIIGVFIFTLLGSLISKKFSKISFFKMKFGQLKKMIKIKNGYGLIGLALITPISISIPVGCILSTAIESNKSKVLLLQVSSVVFWSILLFGLKGIF